MKYVGSKNKISKYIAPIIQKCIDDNNIKIYFEPLSEEEYVHVRDNKSSLPLSYVGFVGFHATFGSKYFGGYARGFKEDKVTPRDHSNESI